MAAVVFYVPSTLSHAGDYTAEVALSSQFQGVYLRGDGYGERTSKFD